MLFATGQLIVGSLLLLLGGDWVVRGASRIAILASLSPLFVGLTVVSLGTSAPEMAVSIATAMDGKTDITVGNVVGSNLFNMLMIVGFSAIVASLPVDRQIVRFDVPVMLGATILMGLAAMNRVIGFWDGVGLLVAMLVYFAISYRLGKAKASQDMEEFVEDIAGEPIDEIANERPALAVTKEFGILALGIAVLVFGCECFVAGAVTYAQTFGLSEAIIGLTIVSVGTSLPELVTSVAATLKGERGIAIGNAVGSTILNIFAVLGVTSIVAKGGIPVAASLLQIDIPVMIGVAALSWFLFRSGHRVARWEGWLMIAIYCGYVGFLISQT